MKKRLIACIIAITMLFMLSAPILAAERVSIITDEHLPQARGTYNNLTYDLYGPYVVITGYINRPSGELIIPTMIEGFPVVGIGYQAFADTSITRVSMSSVTEVDANAFEFCFSLTEVYMPNVQHIHSLAFNNCSMLSSVTMTNAVEIGDLAFSDCTSLQSANIPNVQTIGVKSFYGCSSLRTVSLQNVRTIGDRAFSGCSYLSNIKLDNAEFIGNYAFEYCSTITTVAFKNVSSIGNGAFNFCGSLQEAKFYSDAPSLGNSAFNYCSDAFIIYYPVGATGWSSPDWNGYPTQMFNPATGQYVYTVDFIDGLTNASISSINVESGMDATFPDAPVHEGYTFTGWDNDGKNITADITITALYEEISTPTPTPTTEPTPTQEPDDVVIGDANGDGTINTADAVVVLKHSAGIIILEGNNYTAANTNKDNTVNTADAVLILKYSAGIISFF